MCRKIIGILIFAVCGQLVAQQANDVPTKEDLAIIEIVASHFSARSDTLPYDKNGILLIRGDTPQLSRYSNSEQIVKLGKERGVDLPPQLVSALIKRNQKTVSLKGLLKEQKSFRLATNQETSKPIWDLRSKKQPPIKTLASFALPAYSPDHSQAIVRLEFNWSIHSADATYLLTKEKNSWKIISSFLVFYP